MDDTALPSTTDLIDALSLLPNPQGGWFRPIHQVDAPDDGRPVATIINYLVDITAPISYLHRMSADAVHYFHCGCPLAVVTVSPSGDFERTVLGGDLDAGHQFQVTVPGGYWKGFELVGEPWALISEAVAPGWVPSDQDNATAELYEQEHPHLRPDIERFVAP